MPSSDQELRRAVQAALQADPELAGDTITVTAEDGVVTLAGAVADASHRARAAARARSVPGVEDVELSLRVGSAQRGLGRLADALSGHDYQAASDEIERRLDD
jgi:hypothetical protein